MTCKPKKGSLCVAAAVLAGLTMAQTAPFVSASPASVGRLAVKEAPAPTAEEIALSSINRLRPEKNMGKINIITWKPFNIKIISKK